MVRPSSMALRTFINASSSTAFPEVLAVMLRPSRIGTPEVISVPRVRVKRPTAILRNSPTNHGDVQQHLVEVVAAAGMLADLLDSEEETEAAHTDHPPKRLHECAKAHDDSRGERQSYAQSGKQVRKDRHHPFEQRADDQTGHADHGDRIDQSGLHR